MNKRKLIGNIIFGLVVTIVLLIIIFSLNDIDDIFNVIKGANIWFLILAILFMLIHTFLTSVTFVIVKTGLPTELTFIDTLMVGKMEYLFNAITPFSSGSQPIQTYYFNKLGANYEEATSISLSNFIVYQVTLTIFSTVGMIMYFSKIYEVASHYMWIIVVGYIMNTLMLTLMILIGTVPGIKKVIKAFFRLIGKIKPLNKKMTELEGKTDDFVYKFQRDIKSLFKRKRVLLGTTAIRIVDLIIFNAIPIVLFYAFGIRVSFSDYLYIIMMSAFAQTMMLWVPTPGASGGVEWAYTVLFTAFASTSVIVSSMLLWRFITFYLGMLIGLAAYLFVKKRGRKYENRSVY